MVHHVNGNIFVRYFTVAFGVFINIHYQVIDMLVTQNTFLMEKTNQMILDSLKVVRVSF